VLTSTIGPLCRTHDRVSYANPTFRTVTLISSVIKKISSKAISDRGPGIRL